MIKKTLSSMAVRKVVEEAKVLKGSFFRKAYQVDYGTLVLRFAVKRETLLDVPIENGLAAELIGESEQEEMEGISLGEGGGNYIRFDLYFKMGGYLFFSSQVEAEMPKDPSPFAMKLRKTLRNRVLTDISQVEMDRLVVLTFNPQPGEEDELKLYLELFGDGNAILVKGTRIEAPFTSRSWASRTVKRGEEFAPPPSGIDPFKLGKGAFLDLIKDAEEDLIRFLIRKINLPPAYAEEVCFRADLDKKTTPGSLEEGTLEHIWAVLNDILVKVEEQKGCYIHFINGDATMIEPLFIGSIFKMKDIERSMSRFSEERTKGQGDHFSILPSINDGIETYMFSSTSPIPPEERKRDRAIDRLEKLLMSQEKARLERDRESEEDKLLADALYMDYQRIESLLKEFDQSLYLEEPSGFPDVTSFTPDKRGGGFIKVKIRTDRGDEEVALSLDRDVNQNAELLYEMSKKGKRKLEGILKAIEMTKGKLEKAEKEAKGFGDGEAPKPTLRRFWFENFRWCFSSEKVLMVGGRDARSNDRLVKKYLRDSDLYAHADISGAASIVIRVDKDQEVTERTWREGCHMSVLYSKAWNAKVGSAGAYWVTSDQVSKTPQSGEFVAKGSFIIRGRKNMMDKLPLVGAAGTVYVEGVPKVMFGPESAIKEMCTGTYFRIRPGRNKKSDIVKTIAKELGGDMEQVMSVLPSEDMEIEKVTRDAS